jgi:hypothetical protein
MFEGISARLNFPEKLSERVRLLILHHLRPAMYDPGWSDGAVRRFSSQLDCVLPELLELARADITTKRQKTRRRAIRQLYELRQRIGKLKAEDQVVKPKIPRGLGTEIIQRLGISPGPEIGELRRKCQMALEAGEISVDAPIDRFIEFLRRELAA